MTIDSKKQMKFIRQIEHSSDISSVWELAQAGLRTFGFEFFIYLTVEPDFSDPFCLSNLPKLFLEAPPEEDPFLRYCCDHYEFTFTGADYLDEYEYLPDSARAYITAARELGFYSGFGVPVQLRGSTRFGGLNLGTSLPRHRFENEFLSLQQDIRFFCLITHRKIEQLIQKKHVSKSWDFRGLISAPESEAAKLLTARELEVVHHIGQGLSRKECAIVLGISHNTVSDYVKSAYRKLGVKNRVGAAQRILR